MAQTVRCGGAESAPSPHLAQGEKTARGLISSLSTVPASSVHRVSAPPPTHHKITLTLQLSETIQNIYFRYVFFSQFLAQGSVDGCFVMYLCIKTELMSGK